MRKFLDAHVDRKASAALKLEQLVLAIIDTRTFGVVYDDRTRTASGTFRARRGNCLSFSNMFVAMARDVGLHAEFQEVDTPPDWRVDNETYVLNQHVDMRVDLGLAGTKVVDFNMADFRSTYEMTRISDGRAFAHFYNNIGVERMLSGDAATALWCFRRAAADSRFSPTWTNGHDAHAEAAYLQALEVNDSDLVAMSDLVGLYDQLGDRTLADVYQRRVIRQRLLNPYYRYELARRAYAAHRYDEAIWHLKFAIRQRPKEDAWYRLLGLCYREKGDERKARRWLARAEEVAAANVDNLGNSLPSSVPKPASPP
jgi:Flp pilus assembly protein TadD